MRHNKPGWMRWMRKDHAKGQPWRRDDVVRDKWTRLNVEVLEPRLAPADVASLWSPYLACNDGVGDAGKLHAVNLDPSLAAHAEIWTGQLVYLNLGGAQDVAYQGPIAVSGINVPAFQ